MGHLVLEVSAAGVVGVLAVAALLDVAGGHLESIEPLPPPRADFNSGKEGGELVKLVSLPAVGEVVMALGALDLHTGEHPRHLRGDVGGLPHLRHDDRRFAVLGGNAAGGDHVAGNPVPAGGRFVELAHEKRLERPGHRDGPFVAAAIEDDVAKIPCPIPCPGGIGEQPVDEFGPRLRRGVDEEGGKLVGRGLAAHEVEHGPPEEGGVVAGGRRRGGGGDEPSRCHEEGCQTDSPGGGCGGHAQFNVRVRQSSRPRQRIHPAGPNAA